MIIVKKALSIIMTCVLVLCMSLSVNAASLNVVRAESFDVRKGETVKFPVLIEKNDGIMGFRITLDYSNKVFESPSVTKGDVTAEGNFNDSITKDTKGTFDVLWSATDETTKDGVLFYVKIKVKDDAPAGKYEISLSYAAEDTFDSNLKDVKLNCQDISVTVLNESSQSKSFFEIIWQAIVDFFAWIINLFK